MALVELGIYLVIVAALTGVTLLSSHTALSSLKETLTTYQVAHTLQETRFQALAKDMTTALSIADISVDPQISLSQTQTMAFTGAGSTSKAGTITVTKGPHTRQVTLGVGYAQIAVK